MVQPQPHVPLGDPAHRRYQRASTIVTTNLAFKEWGKRFHNTAVVAQGLGAFGTSDVHTCVVAAMAGAPESREI